MDVPASILKRSNCHGSDGRGKAEEESLGKYSLEGTDQARHQRTGWAPARSATPGNCSLGRLRSGSMPAGTGSDPAMPRYRLTHEQAADLVAYLEVLGRETDPA